MKEKITELLLAASKRKYSDFAKIAKGMLGKKVSLIKESYYLKEDCPCTPYLTKLGKYLKNDTEVSDFNSIVERDTDWDEFGTDLREFFKSRLSEDEMGDADTIIEEMLKKMKIEDPVEDPAKDKGKGVQTEDEETEDDEDDKDAKKGEEKAFDKLSESLKQRKENCKLIVS